MTTLKEFEPGAPKVLLIGASGSGKTCLAATLGARATILDLNNGLASAKFLQDKWTAERQKCEVKDCWSAGTPDSMWKKAASYVTAFGTTPEREALVIDGLSDLAEASLGCVMGPKWNLETIKGATQAEWGVAIAQLERLLWKMRGMKTPLVLIGHTKRV